MNARQRRLVRRYSGRIESSDLASQYGDPAGDLPVPVARHVAALWARQQRAPHRYRPELTRPRERAAWGLRCGYGCGRKAMIAADATGKPSCREHADLIPF